MRSPSGTYLWLWGKILDWIAHRLENVFRSARKPSIQQELPDYQITKSRTKCAENPECNFVREKMPKFTTQIPTLILFSKKRSGMRLICDNIQDQMNWRRGTVLYRKNWKSNKKGKIGGRFCIENWKFVSILAVWLSTNYTLEQTEQILDKKIYRW